MKTINTELIAIYFDIHFLALIVRLWHFARRHSKVFAFVLCIAVNQCIGQRRWLHYSAI